MTEPDHIFWARRWFYARKLLVKTPRPIATIYEMNRMLYLTEVFSFMFDRRLAKR